MTRVQQFVFSFTLLLIKSASCCHPVNEFDSRNFTTANTTYLIGYHLPPCHTLYRLSSVLVATLSKPASPESHPLNITDLLTTTCLNRNATPCTVDIPLKGLDVPVGNTTLNVKVNYTCQLDDPGSIQSLLTTSEKETLATTRVKYIRVKLSSARMDWNCNISSSLGSTVSWSWLLEECTMGVYGCTSRNRTLVTLPRHPETSLFCMEPQSLGKIWVMTDKYCRALTESIAIDIQVPLDSDFDIDCDAETPSNLNDPELDRLKAKCSQLTWTTPVPLPVTTKDLSMSTSRTTLERHPEISSTAVPRNSETSEGTVETAAHNSYMAMHATRLGLGLGLGIGLLVIISAAVLALVCIRRKNRGFDSKSTTLSNHNADVGGATVEKNGGFVLANDVFASKNIYSEISAVNPNPNPINQVQDVQVNPSCSSDINRNGLKGQNKSQNVPAEATAESRYDEESSPPAATSVSPGDRKQKRASTFSRKLFKQIAALAKQEDRQSQIPNGEVARERPEGAVELGGSETSIVDRWLYSSSVGINSAVNTLNQNSSNDSNGIYINQRFEMDI